MRVRLVDPPAYTPPYDHSLATALARAGARVELSTSRPTYEAPTPDRDFAVREDFYRRAMARDRSTSARRALRLAEHLPDMLRHRRAGGRGVDVVHYQWLTLEAVDAALLARGAPRVFTSHNVLRRGGGRLREVGARRVAAAVDAVVVHTRAGARELDERYGADPAKVRVIPHGAFDYLARQPDEAPLPPELAAVEGPVILCFGILRPYKGVDVLIEAFEGIEGAELWIVGRPWMDLEPLHAAAARAGGPVRFVDRFVAEAELPAYFRRADVVALPYREIDQSGVLYTALAFGKAIVASAIGGFAEVAEDHAALVAVPPGDPAALRAALADFVSDPGARATQEARAAEAAAGPYSWNEAARLTLALYEEVAGR
ncbi:MAG TPA: glycosyltransferase family 4 protein [Thermoleophilaceae bacterium]|nr:glycosyltransferase family 4 protein [Thermoleophilaceae bacterium]